MFHLLGELADAGLDFDEIPGVSAEEVVFFMTAGHEENDGEFGGTLVLDLGFDVADDVAQVAFEAELGREAAADHEGVEAIKGGEVVLGGRGDLSDGGAAGGVG